MCRHKHNEECFGSLRLWQKERDKFEKLHPNFCRKCQGWGYIGLLEDAVDCVACVDKMICPLCGEKLEKLEWPPYDKVCTDPDCRWAQHGTVDGLEDPPTCFGDILNEGEES